MPRSPSSLPARFLSFLATLLTGLMLLAPLAQAVPVNDLYEASVPASGQHDTARKQALAGALAVVLTKVSGHTDVASNPTLREALGNATRYAQTFSFVQDGSDAAAPQLRLAASFYPPSIDQLLADAGLPVWGRERPQTIVWLAIEADGARYLLPAEGDSLAPFLIASAAKRGLPISLPLMDIDDRQALTYSDVVGGFTDRILAASQRYGGNSILVGHLRQRGAGDWDARWTHLLGGVQRDWFANEGGGRLNLQASFDAGIGGTADALAQRYAIRAGSESRVEVSVRGVDSISDYARTMNYLGGLSIVERVQPRVVMPGQMLLTLDVKGGRQALADVVALGRLLEPDAGVVDSGSGALAFVVLR